MCVDTKYMLCFTRFVSDGLWFECIDLHSVNIENKKEGGNKNDN